MSSRDYGVPVLGCCGFSGSGKTTLLEDVIPVLRARGISVAVVKHDAHGVDIDRPGKDSDVLFRAGANVLLSGSNESAIRWHPEDAPDLDRALSRLGAHHDLVLVEGHKQTSLPKLWLLGEGESAPPADVTNIIDVLPRDETRSALAIDRITTVVEESWRHRSIRVGILVGGESKRMGAPKQLLEHEGRTLIERVAEALGGRPEEPVLLGAGAVPEGLVHLPRIPDAPGIAGPLGGFVAAHRWAPASAWLMVACDQPLISRRAVEWLLTQRRPGRWAILPRPGGGRLEPFLALYEPQALPLLEKLARSGSVGPWRIAEHEKVASPSPPEDLAGCWASINTPEDLDRLSH